MIKLYLGMAIVLLLSSGLTYHYYKVNKLNDSISNLEVDNKTLNQSVMSLTESNKINVDTIIRLNDNLTNQIVTIQGLNTANNVIEKERDEYLIIFRQHDLTRLAQARPGMIETRINNGTAEVFETIIEATQ